MLSRSTQRKAMCCETNENRFQRRVNGDFAIEFGDEGMTSYADPELFIRYLRRIGFSAQTRRHLSAVVNGGDFGVGVVVLCRG